MDPLALDEVEARVLACLVEKQATTPEYYPMTLNGLTAACNQKSNRDPVTALAEADVVRALDRLQDKGLCVRTVTAGGRVPKYRHVFNEAVPLGEARMAVLCELMLRGPQTVGELKSRAGRMHPFADLDQVAAALTALAGREPPLAVMLPRQPGRKEPRWAQTLTGAPEVPEAAPAEPRPEAARLTARAEDERIGRLEARVAALEAELAAFRRQFE
jgi:uncharacterized protein YceH (UPF0502 family)